MTRGLPLVNGMLEVDGAWEPMEGGDEVGTVEGASQDLSSCWYVMMNVKRLGDSTSDEMAVSEGAIVKMLKSRGDEFEVTEADQSSLTLDITLPPSSKVKIPQTHLVYPFERLYNISSVKT